MGLVRRRQVQLGEDVADVLAHGRLGHHQFAGDRTVRLALGDQGQDLTLTRGEPLQGIAAAAQQLAYDFGVDDGAAVRDLEDGVRSSSPRPTPPIPAHSPPAAAARRLVTDLDDDSIIVNGEWQRHTLGQRVDVWLGDGTKKSLRIAAVMTTVTGDNAGYFTPRNAPGAVVDRVDVAHAAHGADRTDAAAVASSLREAVRASGGHVLTKDERVRASYRS
jgi:putative ABC transport system permease protein